MSVDCISTATQTRQEDKSSQAIRLYLHRPIVKLKVLQRDLNFNRINLLGETP